MNGKAPRGKSQGPGVRRSAGCARRQHPDREPARVLEGGEVADFGGQSDLASFLGLVPAGSSTGARRRQGAITKAGFSHARRLLIEAAWH